MSLELSSRRSPRKTKVYFLNGVRIRGSVDTLADIGAETRSRIVCDLEFSFNIDKKRFGFVMRSDSTEPRNSSWLFHSTRLTVLRKFF